MLIQFAWISPNNDISRYFELFYIYYILSSPILHKILPSFVRNHTHDVLPHFFQVRLQCHGGASAARAGKDWREGEDCNQQQLLFVVPLVLYIVAKHAMKKLLKKHTYKNQKAKKRLVGKKMPGKYCQRSGRVKKESEVEDGDANRANHWHSRILHIDIAKNPLLGCTIWCTT